MQFVGAGRRCEGGGGFYAGTTLHELAGGADIAPIQSHGRFGRLQRNFYSLDDKIHGGSALVGGLFGLAAEQCPGGLGGAAAGQHFLGAMVDADPVKKDGAGILGVQRYGGDPASLALRGWPSLYGN